jgi:hypothetical protein
VLRLQGVNSEFIRPPGSWLLCHPTATGKWGPAFFEIGCETPLSHSLTSKEYCLKIVHPELLNLRQSERFFEGVRRPGHRPAEGLRWCVARSGSTRGVGLRSGVLPPDPHPGLGTSRALRKKHALVDAYDTTIPSFPVSRG